MSKHTPGNWIAEFDGEYWNVVVEGGEGFGREIIGCEGLYRCDGSDEANARLIAAAPELLRAVQAVVNDCHDLGMLPSNERGREITAFEMAISAIEKATGEF
ncbi:MAG: hypothetical protein [Caudoviricetes sp.]|nr:MAG: hypothetical protein [Caudoviricetes sp.]